jgi:hypothetical protein
MVENLCTAVAVMLAAQPVGVEFLAGEPAEMTEAEKSKLKSQDSLGVFRLSCQCTVDQDMHVKVLKPFRESGLDDPGPRPEDHVTP